MKKHYFFVLFHVSFSLLSCFSQPLSWQSRGVGGGGALFSPSINPANHNEYYVACDMSEVFHTIDFGLSYGQVHFSQLQGGHNSKVRFTAAGILYTIHYANDMAIPVKSTDNGLTWKALSGNPDNSEESFTLEVDYNNANHLLLSYYGTLYFSVDGGASFTAIHTAASSGTGIVVAGVFFDGNTIYVGTNDGVLVSINGGTSWNTATLPGIPTGQSIWNFCGAKSGTTVRFFCLTGATADLYVGKPGSDYSGFAKGIYSCDYGTGNWVSASTGINFSNDYPFFLDMAENNLTTVYAAGSNSNGEPTVFKTTNAGASWTNTFKTSSNQNIVTGWSGQGGDRGWGYGECAMGFEVASNDPNYVLISDFGFVHATSNGGTNWQQAYVSAADQHPANAATPAKKAYHSSGLENTTCWQVLWADSLHLFAGFSDIRGVRSTDGGLTWSFNYTGHTGNSTYRLAKEGQANGTLYAATSNIHDMYQSTRLTDAILDGTDSFGKLLFSTDMGATWNDMHVFNHPVFWITNDPNNSRTAYASVVHYGGGTGVGGVYQSLNATTHASSTWTLLPDPPRTQKHPASLVVLNDGKLVATFSGRRDASGAFTASSGCFVYDPVAKTWTDVSDPGMYYWTKDVVIDPYDATQNTWYVSVFSGWGGAPNGKGGLYKTINRGQSWTRISTLDRVTSCTFHPSHSEELYVTTEQNGLWVSTNVHSNTPTFSQVASYPFRQPERVFFNPYIPSEMWVTSFGNGMKVGALGTVTEVAEAFANDPSTSSLYPNPTKGIVTVKGIYSPSSNTSVLVTDLSGKVIGTTPLSPQGSHHTVDLSFVPQDGMYVLQWGNQRFKVSLQR